MLKAVTLDLWDTIFVDEDGPEHERRRAELLAEELSALGTPRSEAAIHHALRAAYDWFEQIWRAEQRTPSATETIGVLFAALMVSPPVEVVARVVDHFENLVHDPPPPVVTGVPSLLPQLAEHYKLALICDTGYTPGSVLRELLSQRGLLPFFTYVYFSNEGGMSKPDPRVFLRALDELGVRPESAAHVGDSQRTDIAGAQQAGMLAVHFIGVNERDAALSSGDVLIRRFEELPGALASLASGADPRP